MKIIVWTNIIMISVIIISIIMMIMYKSIDNLNHGKLGVFLKVISGLTFILIFPGTILAAIAIQKNEERIRVEKTIKAQDINFLKPIDLMRENWNDCPNFIKSLWPQVKEIQDIEIDKNKIDNPISIVQISTYLLQSIENHLFLKNFDIATEIEWSGIFLQWTSSEKFVEITKQILNNFSIYTKQYFDILIEYVNVNGKIKNSEDLEKRRNDFSNDPRIQNILKKIKYKLEK